MAETFRMASRSSSSKTRPVARSTLEQETKQETYSRVVSARHKHSREREENQKSYKADHFKTWKIPDSLFESSWQRREANSRPGETPAAMFGHVRAGEVPDERVRSSCQSSSRIRSAPAALKTRSRSQDAGRLIIGYNDVTTDNDVRNPSSVYLKTGVTQCSSFSIHPEWGEN